MKKRKRNDVATCLKFLDDPKGKRVTLRLNEKRASGSGVLYAPLTIPEDCCGQWTPIKLGGRKFRLLDAFGFFEKEGE